MDIIFEYDKLCNRIKNFDINQIKEHTKIILVYFPELENSTGCMYFDPLIDLKNRLATMFPIKYPHSNLNYECPNLAMICNDYPDLDFAFRFTKTHIEGDKLIKAINISHEFQHAVQYSKNKKTYFYGRIIHYFLSDKIIEEEMIPIEYDAIVKSKDVAINLYGKEKIEEMLDKIFSDPESINCFWALFNSINTEEEYNLEDNIWKLWEEYKIEERIRHFKKLRSTNYDQEKLIEMYDFANF